MMIFLSNLKTRPYVKSQRIDKISSYPLIEGAGVVSCNYHGEIHIKEREVYCEICKYRTMTTYSGPICFECMGNLITIPKCNDVMDR